METETCHCCAQRTLEFHRLSLTAIADPPHTLTTAFTEGNLLSDRGSASGFDAHTIFRNSGFHLLFEQTAFIETKLHSLDDRLEKFGYLLVSWIGYFMKKCPLLLPTDKGTIHDQDVEVYVEIEQRARALDKTYRSGT
jgi:hypothetical protein